MNLKQLLLISSLISIPTLKAENPFENIQGDLTEEQAFEILQHKEIHKHVDTVKITISIDRNKEQEKPAWETIIKRAASFSVHCGSDENFGINKFANFVEATCEDLMNSELHGNISIQIENESEEIENHVEVGYEKS